MTKEIKKKITDRLDSGNLHVNLFHGKVMIRDINNPGGTDIIEDVEGFLKVITNWVTEKKEDDKSRIIFHIINRPIQSK